LGLLPEDIYMKHRMHAYQAFLHVNLDGPIGKVGTWWRRASMRLNNLPGPWERPTKIRSF